MRPEGLRISDDGGLAGHVVSRTFRRDHFLVRVRLAGSQAETLEVAVPDEPPAIGTDIRLAIQGNVVHLAR